MAGRLRQYEFEWQKMTSDQFILESIKGYNLPFFKNPNQIITPADPNWSSEEKIRMEKAIQQLLDKNAISQCDAIEGEFLSPYFLRPKPDGSDRFTLNLKNLNKFIDPPHFKLEDIKTPLRLLTRGCHLSL